MLSSIYADEHLEDEGGNERPSARSLELRDYVITKTAAKVWASVMSTLFGLLIVTGLVEAYFRTSPLAAIGLVGMYGVYSERRVRWRTVVDKRFIPPAHPDAGRVP